MTSRKLKQLVQSQGNSIEASPDENEGSAGVRYLSEVHQRQMRFELAMRHYGEALRINPGNEAARNALAALQSALIRP